MKITDFDTLRHRRFRELAVPIYTASGRLVMRRGWLSWDHAPELHPACKAIRLDFSSAFPEYCPL